MAPLLEPRNVHYWSTGKTLQEEKALLACVAYVDLNPIRAGLSETPEDSDYTSIQERIRGYVQVREGSVEAEKTHSSSQNENVVSDSIAAKKDTGEHIIPAAPLVKFIGNAGDTDSGLPFYFSDYLELVDWTGRAIRTDKHGYIPAGVPPILKRLGVETENWIETVRHFRGHFYDYVGPADALERCSRALGRNWLRGIGACRKLLGSGEMLMPVTA